MKSTIRSATSALLAVFTLTVPGTAQAHASGGNLEASVTDAEHAGIEAIYQRFVPYTDRGRTEFTMVRQGVTSAESCGFGNGPPGIRKVTPADHFHAINRYRTVIFSVAGSEPPASGLRLVNPRMDSIRLEMKPHPLTREQDTRAPYTPVHGRFNADYWTSVPPELTERVDRNNGSVVWNDYAFAGTASILLIPDLALPIGRSLRDPTPAEVIQREELDPLIATTLTGDGARLYAREHGASPIEVVLEIESVDRTGTDRQVVQKTKARGVSMDRARVRLAFEWA